MTLVGHALCGGVLHTLVGPKRWLRGGSRARVAVAFACALLPALPDIDAVSFSLGIPYEAPWGHRGWTHSVGFALAVALILTGVLWWSHRIQRRTTSALKMGAFITVLWASHGVLDSMTTGGKPVLLAAPFSMKRVWAPLRPIPVSPVGGLALLRPNFDRKPTYNAKTARIRQRLLQAPRKSDFFSRLFVSQTSGLELVRPFYLLGVLVTEAALLLPLWLAAFIFRRKCFLPADWPEEAKERPLVFLDAPSPAAPSKNCRRLAVVTGVIALALTGAYVAIHWDQRVERKRLGDAAGTPYLHTRPGHPTNVTAVLLHGWRMSANAMLPMARMLARNGIASFALDQPGQGASRTGVRMDCTRPGSTPKSCRYEREIGLYRDGAAALEQLLAHEHLNPQRVVLIGHSVGGALIGQLPRLNASLDQQIGARVNLEGRVDDIRRGGNHLYVARPTLIRSEKVLPKGYKLGQTYGSFSEHNAFEVFSIRRSHNAMLHDATVNRRMMKWISQSLGNPPSSDVRTFWPFLLAITCIWAVFFVASVDWGTQMLAQRLPHPPSPQTQPAPGRHSWMFVGASAAAVVSTAVVGWLVPSVPALLRLSTVDLLPVPHILLFGLLGWVIFISIGQPRFLTVRASSGWPWLLAPACFALLYGTVGLFAGTQFFHVALHPWRLPRVVMFTLVFLPAAGLLSVWLRGTPAWKGQIWGCLRLTIAWLIIFSLFGAVWGGSTARHAQFLALAAVTGEILAIPLYLRLRSPGATALFTSLVVGWLVATIYPTLPTP